MTTETSNAREGVGRLVAVLDKAVAKLEVNWPNTAMDVREVRSALLNMAWEIEQHSEGARTACNDRIALRSATAPPPAAARGDVRAVLQEMRDRHVARRFKSQTLIDWADRIEAALAAEGVQAGDVEQRARELLAAELYARSLHEDAYPVAVGAVLDGVVAASVAAIASALSQQPEPKAEARDARLGR